MFIILLLCVSHRAGAGVQKQGQKDPCFLKFSYCFYGWGSHGPGGEFLVSVKQKRKVFFVFFFNDQLRYADAVKGNNF